MNRSSALLDWAFSRPDHPGIVTDAETYSFADVRRGVLGAATRLAEVVRPGTRVGLYLDSTPNFVLYQQATFYLGGVVAPLNRSLSEAEVAEVLGRLGIGVVVTDGDLRWPEGTTVLRVDGEFDVPDLADPDAVGPPFAAGPDHPAQVLQTSGSTGVSKGVQQTVGNLAANYDPTYRWIGIGADDVVLLALPIFNTYALNQGINMTAQSGATLRLVRRFRPEHVGEVFDRDRPTFFPTVPTMITRLRQAGVRYDGPLRLGVGAAPSPSKIADDAWTVFPAATLYTGYGLTEATAIVSLNHIGTREDHHDDLGSTGRLVSGVEVRIDAGPGEDRGEVLVRGDLVAREYVGTDAEVPVVDGWLHTGDVGRMVEGRLWIVDRKKDMIIRGGQNIYPGEVERVLTTHPGVLEAAVVGRPDDDLGESPVAFVVLREDAAERAPAALRAWLAERMASFKVPERIEVLEELPRGATGKISKPTLRERLVEPV